MLFRLKSPLVAASLTVLVIAGILTQAPLLESARGRAQDEDRAFSSGSHSVARELSNTFGAVADSIRKSVVSISAIQRVQTRSPQQDPFSHSPLREFFGDDWMFRFMPPQDQGGVIRQGAGSGFVLDHDGHIVTNHHVVGDADEVRVTLWDERSFEAKVIGSDPKTDVAVLEIEADDLYPVTLGDSDRLRVGEWVVAAGNPFGLTSTITTGIVSATGRSFMGITDYEYFIQTDAAINPGNSGGPLVDLEGQVVGINSAIFTRNGGSMGIGFAIPISLANSVIDSLIRTGRVVRGFLGVTIQDIDNDLAESFNYEGSKGALVADLAEDSPAAEAGVARGDIITTFRGKPVESVAQLRIAVAATEPGTEVELEIVRDGKSKSLTVEVGELDGKALAKPLTQLHEEIGWDLRDLTPGLARQAGHPTDTKGALVTEVKPFSKAARAGIRPNDVVIAVHGRPVRSVSDLQQAIDDASRDEGIRLTLLRDEVRRYAFLKLSG